jgi:hypothetical protein
LDDVSEHNEKEESEHNKKEESEHNEKEEGEYDEKEEGEYDEEEVGEPERKKQRNEDANAAANTSYFVPTPFQRLRENVRFEGEDLVITGGYRYDITYRIGQGDHKIARAACQNRHVHDCGAYLLLDRPDNSSFLLTGSHTDLCQREMM